VLKQRSYIRAKQFNSDWKQNNPEYFLQNSDTSRSQQMLNSSCQTQDNKHHYDIDDNRQNDIDTEVLGS